MLSATEIGAPSVFVAQGGGDIVPDIINGTLVIGQQCGDFDQDGDVDTADRSTLTQNWTGALPPGVGLNTFETGDFDGDGDVDAADSTQLITNWTGAQQFEARPEIANFSSVPEPGAISSALVALLLVTYQGRRWWSERKKPNLNRKRRF